MTPTPRFDFFRYLILPIIVALIPYNLSGAKKAIQAFPSFDRVIQIEDSSETSANIAFGDLNGDQNPDLILIKGRHWPLMNRVILGDGKGGFLKSSNLGTDSSRSYSGRLVDLDQDGDLDVVSSNDNPDPNHIYLNDGNGHFRNDSTFGDPNWSTRNLCLVDLNNDQLPDIVVANRSSRRPTPSYIILNIGKGKFSDQHLPLSNGSSTTITAADFNNDGKMDLAVPYRDNGQSYVYLQTSSGPLEFVRVPFGPQDASIRMSKAGDFNKDGLIDLIAIDTKRGVIAYSQNNDGTFEKGLALGEAASRPYALEVADLNHDGAIDIIVGHVKKPSLIYFNKGSGKAFTSLPFGDGRGAVYGFDTGDFNKDGQLDIAAARSGAPNVLYLGKAPEKSAP